MKASVQRLKDLNKVTRKYLNILSRLRKKFTDQWMFVFFIWPKLLGALELAQAHRFVDYDDTS